MYTWNYGNSGKWEYENRRTWDHGKWEHEKSGNTGDHVTVAEQQEHSCWREDCTCSYTIESHYLECRNVIVFRRAKLTLTSHRTHSSRQRGFLSLPPSISPSLLPSSSDSFRVTVNTWVIDCQQDKRQAERDDVECWCAVPRAEVLSSVELVSNYFR